MAHNRSNVIDDVLDRCPHGRIAGEFCPVCDRSELELRIDEIDLREADIDVRDR